MVRTLVDLIHDMAVKRDCSYEEVIAEEVYGHSLREEILADILKKYKR